MGVKIASWQEELIVKLKDAGYGVCTTHVGGLTLVEFEAYGNIVLNLISIDHQLDALTIVTLQQEYEAKGIQLLQLWEDIWQTRSTQVLSRICSLTGNNRKIHGRKTTIISVTQPEADLFLDAHHLQGSAKSRYRYALVANGLTVAVATFSAKRKMTRKHADYNSVELIRFATASGYTVQGGFSKLIKHLVNGQKPNDIMSYTDLDWSDGKGYTRLGFELVEQTPPAAIWLDTKAMTRYFPHRLPGELQNASVSDDPKHLHKMKSLHFAPVFNLGNRKYILYL